MAGFGDQRNYELLREAGFSAEEAIQVLSANGAAVLGLSDQTGTVSVGKRADLVVLDGNPIVTPADIRKVALVFKDGIGYDPARLLASVRGKVGLQ